MTEVHHRFRTVRGHRIFYHEAGPADAPTVVLLHGFPTSSFMFRGLIPRLADRYHVIAPDHVGFGFSDAPSVEEFTYTFDALAEVTVAFLHDLGIRRYALFVQDYGAPVGWRVALADPGAVTAVISQNGNGYEEGFVPEFWAPIWAYGAGRTPETTAGVAGALTAEAIEWQYTHGVPEPDVVSPDTWTHDVALVSRPGNAEVQLALFADYVSNRTLYPRLHAFLREHRPPTLAVWGRHDEIFAAAGAEAFRHDVPEARVELLDGGHFLLESHLDEATEIIREFLASVPE